MDGFQVTLPSNASAKTFPTNGPSHYQTELMAPLQLEGSWEVALVDVMYPRSWPNFTENVKMKLLRNKDTENKIFNEITLKPQYFKSVEELCDCLNSRLNEAAIWEGYTRTPVVFEVDLADKHISVRQWHHFDCNFHLAFSSESIGTTLGFDLKPSAKICGFFGFDVPSVSKELPKLATYPLMFVYSDIIQYQMVGDIKAPLLAVLPVYGSGGDQVYWNFNPLSYIPLANNNISTIEIRLCTETGDPFPIKGNGKVIVRLNFRRRLV